MTDDNSDLILENQNCRLVLAPHIGGSIRSFTFKGNPVFRTAADSETDPLNMASFPLVPFSNRIFGNGFPNNGTWFEMEKNHPAFEEPIHGFGWLNPWTLAHHAMDNVTISFEDMSLRWPQPYRAEQNFKLMSNGLHLALSITNLGSHLMPAGLGIHPYFDRRGRDDNVRLRADSINSVEASASFQDPLPVHKLFPTDNEERAIVELGRHSLDHCFNQSDGLIVLKRSRGTNVILQASREARFTIVYSEPQDYFCVEQVTHAINAPNWDNSKNKGWRFLESGEKLTLESHCFVVVGQSR